MKLFLSKKILTISTATLFLTMCVPPEDGQGNEDAAYDVYLDSLREVRCPRLLSSAAEYYKNRDWQSTINVYREIIDLGCDREDPQEVYQYYAIAYEYLGQYDSSEFVLVKGLQQLPNNVQLRKRLVYAYSKQNKIDLQIAELNRLIDLVPDELDYIMDLSELYGEQGLYEDQIDFLEQVLEKDPSNEKAQSEIALVYEKTGRDPLDVYRKRFEKNSENVSYGLDLAERLLSNDEADEAVDILEKVIQLDKTSKLAYRKLGQAYFSADNLNESSNAYEELFELNPRDINIALKICDVNIANQKYAKALRWADKAISIDRNKGESYGRKGNVYYKSFQDCRNPSISLDDRVVATFAYRNFDKANDLGYSRFNNTNNWFSENEVLFKKIHWFMLDDDVKNQGYVTTQNSCYSWINEKLKKDSKW